MNNGVPEVYRLTNQICDRSRIHLAGYAGGSGRLDYISDLRECESVGLGEH